MPAIELLITDVTEMHGGNYCVAGWYSHAQRMVRPLPGGANWTAGLLALHGVSPGVRIRVEPTGAAHSEYPHLTEDTFINPDNTQSLPGAFPDWLGPAAPMLSPSLENAFQFKLSQNGVWQGYKYGVHVICGTQCRSLVAIRVARQHVTFEVDDRGKLRVRIFDGFSGYQLAVSSHSLKNAWRVGGLPGVDGALPNRATLHARIGLARAFGNSPKCYAMLNGVL